MSLAAVRRRSRLINSPGQSDNPNAPYPGTLWSSAAAYDLRQYSSTSTKAIRVQRASDSTQIDIGFVGRDLDTRTLLNFCSGTTGTVAKWYDQSGNGKDLVQATTAAQPIIVNNGNLVVSLSNKPTLSFDGNRYLACSSLTLSLPLTHICVATVATTTSSNSMFGGSTNVAAHGFFYSNSTGVLALNNNSSVTGMTFPKGKPQVAVGQCNWCDSTIELNPNTTRSINPGTIAINGFEVGSWQSGTLKLTGNISAYYLYGSVGQVKKSKVVRELSNYYGVSYSIPTIPAYTKGYVFVGDSLTYGQNSTGTTNDWPYRYVNNHITAGTYFEMNDGVPGYTISDMQTKAAAEAGALTYFYPQGVPITCWVMAGTNDIIHNAASSATAYSNLKSLITNLVNTGKYTQIGVCTLPPSGVSSGSFASTIQGYNNLIRGSLQTDLPSVTAIANLQSNSNFDDTPANVTTVTSNATYYNTSDNTHLTNTGYDAVATIAAAALQ
jgi:lysophospholipase L1-like esterase